MIGIDVLEVERMERALERSPALRRRLFSEQELAYAETHARPAIHLAARFCAKEAVAKALGLEAWSFNEVEVEVEGGRGPPRVRLTGAAAERAAALGVEVAISLTHSRGHAAAVALAA